MFEGADRVGVRQSGHGAHPAHHRRAGGRGSSSGAVWVTANPLT